MVALLNVEARLDAASREGDPVADAVVASLGDRVWAVNAVLGSIERNDDAMPAGVPANAAAIVAPSLPPWADIHRIRSAQAFAERNLPMITVALFCAALPASYAAARGAGVLAATGRLHRDLDRRVNETARFVLEVVRPHGLEAGGRGRIATGKVRLIHAAVRALLHERSGTNDVPINQEDMLGTIGLFGVGVLDALARLGVALGPRDRDDYAHLWCVTGAMLGVRDDHLPREYASMKALLRAIRARQVAPSEHGAALMRDLLAGMERHVAIPGLRDLPRRLVRELVGHDLADMLAVPIARGPLDSPAFSADRLGSAAARAFVGRRFLEVVTAFKLGGERATFPMPSRLG